MANTRIFLAVIKQLKLKHWVKNVYILLPLFFSGRILEYKWDFILTGFLAFSFLASSIYVFNDLCDIEKDRKHPQKCKRPLASGVIPKSAGVLIFLLLSLGSLCWGFFLFPSNIPALLIMVLYLVLNIGYSLKWKNIPILDIAVLATGFLLRLLFGGCYFGIAISPWLYLTVLMASFYMGVGKRLNEKINSQKNDTRAVLTLYSKNYLENLMTLSATSSIIFYSQWSAHAYEKDTLLWTVPLVILAFFRYSYVVEHQKNEDPVQIVLKDKALLCIGGFIGIFIFISIYGSKISMYLRSAGIFL